MLISMCASSGIAFVVAVFNIRAALATGVAVTTSVFITDGTFSIIVTYIFLEPVLDVLKAARGKVRTMASRRLERTKRWNFAGVVVTVGSVAALYVNFAAFFSLSFLRNYSLSESDWANPLTFGADVGSIAKTLGMVLLCGMFKDIEVKLSSRRKSTQIVASEGQYITGSSSCVYSRQCSPAEPARTQARTVINFTSSNLGDSSKSGSLESGRISSSNSCSSSKAGANCCSRN